MVSDRPRPAPWRTRLPWFLALAALLLLAVLAARGGSAVPHANGLIVRGRSDPGRLTLGGGDVPPGHQNSVITAGLTGVIAIILVSYLVGTIVLLVMLTTIRLRRARKVSHRGGDDNDDASEGKGAASAVVLLRGARTALANLRGRAGGPPSDAVVRAWLVLEEAAAEGGTARRPDQTSTEFTAAVLAEHDVDPAALTVLRTLYQRARFGRPDTVTERDAAAAVDALDRIADTLTVLARTAETPVAPQ